MKRRKNADDALRAAERRADSEGTPEAIKNYWRKALQAGRLPKPTFAEEKGLSLRRYGWTYNINTDAPRWQEEEPESALPRVVLHVLKKPREEEPKATVYLQEPEKTGASHGSFMSVEEAEEYIKRVLSHLIQEENPRHSRRTKRRNADDKLRRLQRAAESLAPTDIAAYWRAQLKAGITPEHTIDITSQDGTRRMQVWSINLRPNGGYGYRDPRIVLQSAMRFYQGKRQWMPIMLTKWTNQGIMNSWDKQLDFAEPEDVKQLLQKTLLEHIEENA